MIEPIKEKLFQRDTPFLMKFIIFFDGKTVHRIKQILDLKDNPLYQKVLFDFVMIDN